MEIVFDHVSFIINRNTPLEKTILDNISFEIKEKGVYSFVGCSNSGKTAIGDLIDALIEPNDGEVKISIDSDSKIKKANQLRKQIGYVYKNPYDMFFNKTVKNEIEFGIKHFKYNRKDRLDRINDIIKLCGLDESLLSVNPQLLTLSDAKKVALACILAYDPKIVILDEYTNGLNGKEKKDLLRLIRILKTKYDKIIILLSKDTTFCYEISDKVYLMHLTKIIEVGDKNILRNSKLLKENDLEVPKIVDFIDYCNKKGHDINQYSSVLDLIKAVYRDVF